MIVNLSTLAANHALDAINEMMRGGSIELLAANGSGLCTLRLSDPAANMAGSGQLEFRSIREGTAISNGVATAGRVVGSNGNEVFSCDVGDRQSDAVIKLSSAQIVRGVKVTIDAFTLAMP